MSSLLYLIAGGLAGVALAAPVAPFDASLDYTFTAECSNPPGAPVYPGGPCTMVHIEYTAEGATSLFAHARLTQDTQLNPALPGPFPFTGTFVLTDLDNPADSVTGTLAGAGHTTGPPGPPVGFPPFGIDALFTITGGTGAYAGATGASRMTGTALFDVLNENATLASGTGFQTFTATPEPGTVALVPALIAVVAAARRRARAVR